MQFFFHDGEKIFSSFDDALAAACEGLIYISETDAPIVPFRGKNAGPVTVEAVLKQTGKPSGTPAEERDFHEFFERLTRDRDWFGDAERARAKKFLELQKLLEENLVDLKVYRFGQIRLDIYVVGVDLGGSLIGVSTSAVET
jgi:hypothetical protein